VVPVHDVGVDREATAALDLALRAEVDDRAQAEGTGGLEVGAGQALHAVGSVELPEPGGPTVVGGQPAEVADVEDELEPDPTVGGARRVGSLLGDGSHSSNLPAPGEHEVALG
jgi:hypothetical protein